MNAPHGDGTLVVARPRGGFADRGRKYKVVVDREARGAIKAGDELVVHLPAGEHEVRIVFTWTDRFGSAPLDVSVASGEVVRLLCAFKKKKGIGWPLDRSPRIALTVE